MSESKTPEQRASWIVNPLGPAVVARPYMGGTMDAMHARAVDMIRQAEQAARAAALEEAARELDRYAQTTCSAIVRRLKEKP